MNKIIDCHLHVITKKDFEIYKKTSCADYFVNIRGLNIEEMLKPYKFEEFLDIDNMFFLDSVDLNFVDDELVRIEKDTEKYPKILGIKIYLGYQKFYANDKKIFKVAEFANKHNLAVTFHCGEIFNEEGESEVTPFSNAKYIEGLLKAFPNVNFVASHLNWPNFDDLFSLMDKYDNIYTCFSGCNDGETEEDRKQQNCLIAETLNNYFAKNSCFKKRVMYGTDFFASSDEYNDVASYYQVISLLNIDEKDKENILYNNAIDAYNIKIK